MGHMRFVVRIARGYRGYGLPLEDLVQEGAVGLMQAVRRFDPAWNVRLISYAVHWIRAQIHDFILRNFRIVRRTTTRAQRKLFFRLRSLKHDSRWLSRAEIDRIADQLQVSIEDVRRAETMFYAGDRALHGPREEDAPEHWLTQEGADPAERIEAADWNDRMLPRLQTALRSLDERTRDIVCARGLTGARRTGLAELGRKYGVSAERVRQIESRGHELLRTRVTEAAA
jgi:RNA polymerase sigma-32 factor